jgi:hypothetical protein
MAMAIFWTQTGRSSKENILNPRFICVPQVADEIL